MPDELVLPSLVADTNDVTKKSGWWMDDVDLKTAGKVAAQIKELKKAKQDAESNNSK